MHFNHLLFEIQDEVAWVSLHRPEKLNALNRALLEELHQLFSELRNQEKVRVIVLTGSGEKAFVAGADISEFASFNSEEGRALAQKGQEEVFDFIAKMNIPVIAAINGYALGGGLELALACHIRIATTTARLGLPEASLGLIPGYGGTQRLAQIIGRGRATEMILSCRMLGAEEALGYGLVSQVVAPENLMATAAEWAERLLKNAPQAQAQAIKAIDANYTTPASGFKVEQKLFGDCFDTADFKEGTSAFLEKRKADFSRE